ncbi:hypothetical protein Hanom_Chr12g01089871 [Helianthus anomalus]
MDVSPVTPTLVAGEPSLSVGLRIKIYITLFFYSLFPVAGHHTPSISISSTATDYVSSFLASYPTGSLLDVLPPSSSSPVGFLFLLVSLSLQHCFSHVHPVVPIADLL